MNCYQLATQFDRCVDFCLSMFVFSKKPFLKCNKQKSEMASGNDTKKCVLHVDSKVAYNGKGIQLFNEKSLEKCKKAQTVYESRGSSKYKAVQLPMVPDGCSG